jgi:hypothetical protein
LEALDTPSGSGELRRARHDIDGEAKIFAVSRSYNYSGVVQPKTFGDVLPDPWGCRCREGKHGGISQALSRIAKTEVGRPEIVPPFRDAVSFIDAQKR